VSAGPCTTLLQERRPLHDTARGPACTTHLDNHTTKYNHTIATK
jgi:hypothetical protein